MNLSTSLTDAQRVTLAECSRDDDAYHRLTELVEGLLTQAERRFQALFERTNDAIFLIGTDDTLIDVNQRAADLLGYSIDELHGMHASIPVLPAERQHAQQVGQRLSAGETLPVYERTFVRRDGTSIRCEIDIALVFDEQGHELYTQSIVRDISERKQLEDQLKTERNLLRTVIEAIPDHIYVKDRQSRFTLANQALVNAGNLGTPANLLGKTDLEVGTPNAEAFIAEEQRFMASGEPIFSREYHINEEGYEDRYVLVTKVPLYDDQGECIGLVGINHSITSLKRLERRLRAERNLLRTVIDTIPDPIYVKDRQSRFTLINQAMLGGDRVGMTATDLLGKSDLDLGGEKAPGFYAAEQHLMATGEPIINLEDSEHFPDNPARDIWVLLTKLPLRDEDGNIVGLVGISRDITPTKRLERRVIEERNLLRTVIDTLPDSIYVKDQAGRFTLVNNATWNNLGVAGPELMLGKTDFELFSDAHRVDPAMLHTAEQHLMATGEPLFDQRLDVVNQGQPTTLLITKVPLRNQQGAIIGLVGINRNITVTLDLENQLRAERNLLRKIIDAIPDPIYVKDREGRFTLVNEAISLSDTRYAADHFIGKNDIELWGSTPNARAFHEAEQQLMATGEPIINYSFNNDFPYAPDNNHVLITKVPLRDENDAIIGLIGINRNVAALKRLENELRTERNLLRSLIDAIPDVIYIKDRQARFVLTNSRQEQNLARFAPGSPIGRTDYDYFGEYAQADYQTDIHLMETGQPVINHEFRIPAPFDQDVGSVWVAITKVPLRDANGEIIGLVGINRDISPIKRLQEQVQDERNLLRTIIDAIPDEIYVKDREMRFLLVNQTNLVRRGFSDPAQIIGKSDADLFPEMDAASHADEQRLLESGASIIYHQHHILDQYASAERQWLMISKVPLRNAAGEIVGLVGINHNITPLKKLEQELRTERNLLRTIIDAIPDEIYVKDREMRFTLLNRASREQKQQFYRDDPIGKTDADLFPVLADVSHADEDHLFATGTTIVYNEYHNPPEYRTPEREWLTITKVPLRDDSGEIIGVVGINHNITIRKQLEEDLRSERNLLRSVIDAIPEDIYVKDRNSRFILVNRALLNKLGLRDADQLIGLTDFDIMDPEAQNLYLQEQALMQTDKVLLNQVSHSDGITTTVGEHWITITKVPLHDANRQVIGLIGINHDITTLKKLEQSLRDERNLLRGVIDAIPDDIYVKDRNSRFIMVNRSLLAKLGIAHADQIMGLTDFDLFGLLPRDFYLEEQRLMNNDEALISQPYHTAGEGTVIGEHWVTISKLPLHGEAGQVIGLIGVNHDVTPLMRLEQRVRDERNLLRSVIDAIPDEIYVKDRESRFILVNQAMLAISHMPSDADVLGKTDEEVYTSEIDHLHRDREQHIMATGQPMLNAEFALIEPYITADRQWILISKVPLRNAQGAIIGFIGINHNITPLKRLEQRIRDERNLLRTVIDAIPDEIYVKDAQHRFILVNQALLKAHNHDADTDLLGKDDGEAFGILTDERHRPNELRIMETGEAVISYEFPIEQQFATEDRSWMLMTKVPLRDADGHITGLVGINHNITPLKRLEQRIRDERNLLRTVIDAIPDEIYVKDRESRFLLVNRAVEDKIGFRDDSSIIGKTDFDLFSLDVEQNYADEQHIISTGEALVSKEYYTPGSDTTTGEQWLLISKLPLQDMTGQIVGVIGINHNVTPLKRLEQRIRDERNLLRTVIDAIPDEIYVKDRESRFILVNRATAHTLNLPNPDVLIGKHDRDIYPVEADQLIPDEEQLLLSGQPIINQEMTIRDGKRIDLGDIILVTKVPLRDASGQITGIIGINRNITALKRMQQDLVDSQRFIERVTQTMPDIVYVLDLSTRRPVYVNRSLNAIVGQPETGDLLDLTFADMTWHPDDYLRLEEVFQQFSTLDDGQVIEGEHRYWHTAGEWRWLRLRTAIFRRDPAGRALEVLGILQDVTSSKHAQDALRESEQRLRATAANLPNGAVYLFDHDLRYLIADGRYLREQGFLPEQIEGRTLAEIWPPEVVAVTEPIYRRTLAGETRAGELEFNQRVNGYQSQPILDSDGGIIAGLVIVQDLTDQRKAQAATLEFERLRVAIAKEQELNDLKTRMMIRISHEFRTPLAIIGTSSELLQRYYHRMDEDRRTEHFSRIADQINRIAAILDDITLIMRVQMSGRIALTLDIQAVCAEVLRTEPQGQRVNLSCDDYIPPIEGDQEMILRMVHNVVSNAIKYSQPDSMIDVRLSADNAYVHLAVRDTGSGIPEADLPRIFEPFYRGSNIDEVQGMGLGLSIVQAVVNLHGGQVEVDSRPGRGTTVTLHLPLVMPGE